MAIGSKIQELLNEQNRNVRWLEKEACVSHNTLYSIIRRDSHSVDAKTLQVIANVLHTTPEYLSGISSTKENILQEHTSCIQSLLKNCDYQLTLNNNSVYLEKKDMEKTILIESTFISELHNKLENICKTALKDYSEKH